MPRAHLTIARFILVLNLHIPLAHASHALQNALAHLLAAYPDQIKAATPDNIIWGDGTCMPLCHHKNGSHDTLNDPSLQDQLEQPSYILGIPESDPSDDPGRIRYEPFFRKMYGNSPEEVKHHLTFVSWMPRIFGHGTYQLPVTTINNVHEKIARISQELEDLVLQHPELTRFLARPGGTFNWRNIANTTRLSNHSFGMTLDINATESHYWQWDLTKDGKLIDEQTPLNYRNTVPWEIVQIFEKHGFIWGGKWYHYDTMHFEYRPELLTPNTQNS